MKSLAGPALALAAAGLLAAAAPGDRAQEPGGQEAPGQAEREAMARAVAAVLAPLKERAADARAPFDDPERRQWAFGPVERLGVSLGQIEDEEPVEALLDTVLSEAGLEAFRQIRELEHILRRRESKPGRPAAHRDADLYWLRVYGEPGTDGPWGWRFEGHHFALHVSCVPGAVPTITPFFLGASPLAGVAKDEWREGVEPRTGMTVEVFERLAERSGAAAESMGLNPDAEGKPRDIRMGPGVFDLPDVEAWRVTNDKALATVRHVVSDFESLLDGPFRRCADELDLESAHFQAWHGEGDGEHGWCVRGDGWMLELMTTTGPDHVHIVLRDERHDFGGPDEARAR